MCDQHSLNEIITSIPANINGYKKNIFGKDCLILKEKKFFYIIACITIFFFSLVFAGTFFRDEIQDSIQENIVTDYRDSLSENDYISRQKNLLALLDNLLTLVFHFLHYKQPMQ